MSVELTLMTVILTFLIKGSWQPMGDVDFYPNGGRVQHGCSNLFVGAVTDFIWCKLYIWLFNMIQI